MSAFDSFTPHNVCFIEVPKAFQERKAPNEERSAALTNQTPFSYIVQYVPLKGGRWEWEGREVESILHYQTHEYFISTTIFLHFLI